MNEITQQVIMRFPPQKVLRCLKPVLGASAYISPNLIELQITGFYEHLQKKKVGSEI